MFNLFIGTQVLDQHIMFSFTELKTCMVHHNELFAWTGDPQHISKHRFVPINGSGVAIVARIVANLQGQRPRWMYSQLSHQILTYAIAIDIIEHLRIGNSFTPCSSGLALDETT